IIPHPPRSTLFPYTTLFRSSVNISKNSLLTPISLGPWWPSLTITFLISPNLPSSNRPLILWLLSYQEVSKLVRTWILFFFAKDRSEERRVGNESRYGKATEA